MSQQSVVEVPAAASTKAGWRVEEWAKDCGLSRSYAYNLMKQGTIRSVRVGRNRIITTTPAEFLAAFDAAALLRLPRLLT